MTQPCAKARRHKWQKCPPAFDPLGSCDRGTLPGTAALPMAPPRQSLGPGSAEVLAWG